MSETLSLCKESILTPKVEPKAEKSFNMAKKMSQSLTNKLIQNLTKETTNLQDVVDSVKQINYNVTQSEEHLTH